MLLAAPNKITYEEFLEWINEERHAEWVDGEIIEMSPVPITTKTLPVSWPLCSGFMPKRGSSAKFAGNRTR